MRDALLGRPVHDIDLASTGDPTEVAREFAKRIDAPWFWLDKERRQSRVLVTGTDNLTFDFAPFRAADLKSDLEARDFTINSLTIPLPGPVENRQIIDPLGGMQDLVSSTLRTCSSRSFESDPLRILKGIRHAVRLGFVLEEATSLAMVRHAWQLDRVAVERIRQELWTIMAHPAAVQGLELLSSTGVGDQLWGDAYNRALPDIVDTFERCRREWSQLAESEPVVVDWLAAEAEQGLTREVLLLWGLAFSCIEPDLPSEFAEEWRLSRRSQSRIKSLGLITEALLAELKGVADSPRAFALWLQKNGIDAADLLLIAPFVAAASTGFDLGGLLSRIPLVDESLEEKIADLVDGNFLSSECGLAPGPAVGAALEAVRDAEISGLVVGEEQARAFLRNYSQNKH